MRRTRTVSVDPRPLRSAGSLGLAIFALAWAAPAPASAAERAADAEMAVAEHRTERELNRFTGKPPRLCVPLRTGARLCEWKLDSTDFGWKEVARAIDTGDRVNLICRLPDGDGAREAGSCRAHPQRSDRSQYRVAKSRERRKRAKVEAQELAQRARAQAAIDAATDLASLTRLMGELPAACFGATAGERVCTWRATSRTLGQGTIATSIDVSTTKKVRLRCSLPEDGGARRPGSCLAEVGD